MLEAMWAGVVLVLLGAATATVLVPWESLLSFGRGVMLASAAAGIPLELIYFFLLWVALGRAGTRPKGWYLRSFVHHPLLSARARRVVLPPFYLGALAFLGIA